jgi:hypothetical protein
MESNREARRVMVAVGEARRTCKNQQVLQEERVEKKRKTITIAGQVKNWSRA